MNGLSLGRALGQRVGLGRFLYHFYHAPRGFLRNLMARGISAWWRDIRAHRAMKIAALSLTAPDFPSDPVSEVHFLTGSFFWHQTVFCAVSLLRSSSVPIRFMIYDDGTLQDREIACLLNALPQCKIIRRKEIEARIDRTLPRERFPALRARRDEYPHLKKLTDIHSGASGWKLVLDSDMLFFRRPDFLLDWLRTPIHPLYMQDVETMYGYSKALLEELAGGAVPERVNVGICGLKSDDLDWDILERWCATMLKREGSHYVQEQALVAMLMAGTKAAIAPATDYICLPSESEVREPTAVIHHYVAESKSWYYRYGWRHVAGP